MYVLHLHFYQERRVANFFFLSLCLFLIYWLIGVWRYDVFFFCVVVCLRHLNCYIVVVGVILILKIDVFLYMYNYVHTIWHFILKWIYSKPSHSHTKGDLINSEAFFTHFVAVTWLPYFDLRKCMDSKSIRTYFIHSDSEFQNDAKRQNPNMQFVTSVINLKLKNSAYLPLAKINRVK